MPLWLIPIYVIFLGAFGASGVAGMVLQCGRRVKAPSAVSYRVVAGPTGLPWVSTLDLDARWIALPVHWVRWLRRQPRTWSVTVTEAKNWWDKKPLLVEEFPTRRMAFVRFDETSKSIESGTLFFDFGSSGD